MGAYGSPDLQQNNTNNNHPEYKYSTYQNTYKPDSEKGGCLMAEQKIAIGKTVIGTKDTLMAIIPREDGMLISTMFYEDEIKDLPKSYNKPEVAEPELKMAKALINSMDTPFNPAEYTDEYQIKLKELIEQKINGQEIVAAKEEGQPSNVINLMDALKASLEQTKPAPKKKSTKKEKGA
jgi:DNA end-binding protein Ku